MTPGLVLHHALLGLSVAALAAAGLRAASTIAPGGLERVLAAAAFATAAAVGESLLLGLLALGGSTVALSLAALATWAVTHRVLPAPRIPVLGELARWWGARPPAARAGLGAVAGALAAWTVWQLYHPELGIDTILYHLPEMAMWVQQGTPGSIETVTPLLPVGNYPLTAEVSTAWAMGISRSLVPVVLSVPVAVALAALAGWAGLRALRVPALPRGVAVAAFCTSPWLLGWTTQGTITDPPALAWLVTCGALCAASRANEALLAPAVVAGGLSVGCKTTTLPMVALALALGLWAARAHLRSLARPLAIATGAAALVGGAWYARNLIGHGSPFWPIVAGPLGDPVPRTIARLDATFLEHTGRAADLLGDAYLDRFGGDLLLLAGALVAPLVAWRRRVTLAALVVAGGLILWATTPLSGIDFSASRYLLPVVAAATLTLALAAGTPGPGRYLATAALAAAAVVNVVQMFKLGYPDVPPRPTPLLGALAGALAGLALAPRVLQRAPRRASLAPAAAVAAVVAGAALLALPANGFLAHHAAIPGRTNTPLGTVTPGGTTRILVRQLRADPRYSRGTAGVATSPVVIGPLAGDRLTHRLSYLAAHVPCPALAARARGAWLIVADHPLAPKPARVTRCLGGAGPAFRTDVFAAFPPRG